MVNSHEHTSLDLYQYALTALAADLCVIPPKQDGSKRPDGEWKCFQEVRPSVDTISHWYLNRVRTGIGYVTGQVSGNLECFEFDCFTTYEAFIELAHTVGLGDLVDRIANGYEESTPGGGRHWLTRCSVTSGNTILAKRPKRQDERRHEHDHWKVLIETRGEGGYIVSAPSHGLVHESGKAYILTKGSVNTITTVTPQERRDLWELARSFDQSPVTPPPQFASNASGNSKDRPGDLFSAATDWQSILSPHGWNPVCNRGSIIYWRRPGKEHGVSASTNFAETDRLYVFSTSTELPSGRLLSKFATLALLEFGGDLRAAANWLRARGYRRSDRQHVQLSRESTRQRRSIVELTRRSDDADGS